MVKTPIRLYPKKGFCPSLKIYRGNFIHLVKKGRGDFILVAKNMGGIISTYTKLARGDSFQGGGGDFVRIPSGPTPWLGPLGQMSWNES